LVHQITVPTNSLLARHKNRQKNKEYKDAYTIQLPKRYKLLKGTGSKNEITVAGVASSFFHSNLFKKVEYPLIRLVCNDNARYPVDNHHEDSMDAVQYRRFRFIEGDRVLVWTVVERRNNEILMRWEEGGVKGTTWFNLPNDENCIMFGSSIELPSSKSDINHSGPSTKLFIQASNSLREDRPVGERVKKFLINIALGLAIPLHSLYSKYLLASTVKKLDQNKFIYSK